MCVADSAWDILQFDLKTLKCGLSMKLNHCSRCVCCFGVFDNVNVLVLLSYCFRLVLFTLIGLGSYRLGLVYFNILMYLLSSSFSCGGPEKSHILYLACSIFQCEVIASM